MMKANRIMEPMSDSNSGNFCMDNMAGGSNASSKAANVAKSRSPSNGMTRHTKRPPSERRFKCDQCERMFFTRKDVKRHLVVHTGQRNFGCPFCQQRFGRKDHLVRHAKKSHNRDTRASAMNSGPCRKQPHLLVLPQENLNQSPLNYSNSHSSESLHGPANMVNEINDGNQSLSYLCNNSSVNNASSSLAGYNSPVFHHIDSNMNVNCAAPSVKAEPVTVNGNHHYFHFPISAQVSPFMPPTHLVSNCFVNNNANASNCHHPGSLQIPHEHPVTSHQSASYSIDVSTSLPHFNQAFQ